MHGQQIPENIIKIMNIILFLNACALTISIINYFISYGVWDEIRILLLNLTIGYIIMGYLTFYNFKTQKSLEPPHEDLKHK